MMGNTFGKAFSITTWGESHGPAIGVVIDGCPPGLELTDTDIQLELDRRRPGQSEIATPRQEEDKVEILSGVFEGKTTGTPIAMQVKNKDADSSKYDIIRNMPRPGHADYTYQMKYGLRDHRGGGRSSARETIGRVAGGAVAKKILARHGIEILAYVVELGGIKASPVQVDEIKANDIKANVESNPVRCADPEVAKAMLERVKQAREDKDSIGGIVEILALGVPPGLGEPVFDKLDCDLAGALMGIGAVKGVEIGSGFAAATMTGSQMNDPFEMQNGKVVCSTNNAGGILGGISSGETIVCRIAVKPTPSIARSQRTVDMSDMFETNITIEGRHDPTIPPRIVPVAEAMTALVLADHLIRAQSYIRSYSK
ncbi:MAG: chorismate synthase [ANME-2 cluster archaeon]|nr:chorismate synthase [ANME-2 cluster archaeon]MBC2699912.1 chorismate synthase [ANME-2 cluster archaeon]MBC2707375.1 chorismate synthase [ANME-2 cluster archaeon]MBC2748663.1 chorismate synthase [ANME-2 cluster archaeon]MBC2762511.1 chorismate synthase [ANME-2 cluster archaeon]